MAVQLHSSLGIVRRRSVEGSQLGSREVLLRHWEKWILKRAGRMSPMARSRADDPSLQAPLSNPFPIWRRRIAEVVRSGDLGYECNHVNMRDWGCSFSALVKEIRQR